MTDAKRGLVEQLGLDHDDSDPTKRELFAAMAMQGLVDGYSGCGCEDELIAWSAVRLADALLVELAREQTDAT